MAVRRLVDLPDDIIFHVFAHLDTARDLGSLALSSRRLYHLVTNEAWSIFVRRRFPSLAVSGPATRGAWRELAESLTWQSRCWDKRALRFQAILPARAPQAPRVASHGDASMVVVDAHHDPATKQELVVWGRGPHLAGRHRKRRGKGVASAISWHKKNGEELGFAKNHGDVVSVKVIGLGDRRAVVCGRFNGHLSVLSAEPDTFGDAIATLRPASSQSPSGSSAFAGDSIMSLDVVETSHQRLLAATTHSELNIYDVSDGNNISSTAVLAHDAARGLNGSLSRRSGKLCNARWLGNGETLALAFIGGKASLQYLSLTPSGWTWHAAAKNERLVSEFGIKENAFISPRSVEPIRALSSAGGHGGLVLSGWRDGTIRLQDLRTPSPFDTVYQDNVDPRFTAETLMAYGTERFVAGADDSLTIQVFDLRWSKRPYHYSAALPCLDRAPFPKPYQPFMEPPASSPAKRRGRCDHVRGLPCTFHGLSRSLYCRPNAKFFAGSRRTVHSLGVWSLARGSDISPSFYVGSMTAVIEVALEETPRSWPGTGTAIGGAFTAVDPNFGFDDWRASAPAGSGYRTCQLGHSMMETGDGYMFKGNEQAIRLPPLTYYEGARDLEVPEPMERLGKHHRLDFGYQQVRDFMARDWLAYS
ncbi:hypothetical protein VTJ83DRAFT_5438 [Remersonia thermophila]|uniref:F-box domain-containing protein n=1 Tax=Remersonia thermophila TaxID=72144 RepID=A0ABR4D6X8_9PEZI